MSYNCYLFIFVFFLFFFFKQKTAYEMRISDWSSDVCSSDLAVIGAGPAALRPHEIIDALALHEERPLDIAGRRDLLVRLAIRERLDRDRKSTRLNSSH